MADGGADVGVGADGPSVLGNAAITQASGESKMSPGGKEEGLCVRWLASALDMETYRDRRRGPCLMVLKVDFHWRISLHRLLRLSQYMGQNNTYESRAEVGRRRWRCS